MKLKLNQAFQAVKLTFFTLIFPGLISSAFAKDFYVSPNGNDSNPGTKNLPLKTILQAKKMAAEKIVTGEPEVTIWLADGVYHQEEPLVFEPFKSMDKNAKVHFKAEKNAKPVVSGGVQITGWKLNSSGLWETVLPAELEEMKNVRELFINGKRAGRARFPNEDYLRVKKVGEDKRTNFFFEKSDFPVPEKTENVELVLLHDWSISRIGVKEIDLKENRLTAVDTIGTTSLDFFRLDGWEPNPRYFLENAPEFMDVPFEWFYDAEERIIKLLLPENDSPDKYKIVIPVAKALISIQGKENSSVKNIQFEGITFQHCNWQIPESGYCGVQACHFDPRPERKGWKVVPAAIYSEWGENISFKNCRFENLGGSGLWFGTGSENCSVSNSEFADISGNGIMIGEGQDREVNGQPWWKSAPEQAALGNVVENCTVTDCGKQFFGAVGVWCGLTAETVIKNNEIFNLPYSGVSVGWMWSPVPTPCRKNTIDGNHIHDIMNILSDGGGIYMLGLQPESIIRNNHIHDVEINAGRAESNGMFLDEGITDVLVENNLIYNIAKSPLRFHKATTNLVKNNYLFCANGNPPIRYNSTKEDDIQKVGNQVYNKEDANYKTELEKAVSEWKK